MNILNSIGSYNLYSSNTNNLNGKNININKTPKKSSNNIIDIPDKYDEDKDGKWDIESINTYVLYSSDVKDFSITYKCYKTDEYPKMIVEVLDENFKVTSREYIDPTNLNLENISFSEAIAYSAYMYEEGKFDILTSHTFMDLIARDMYPEIYTEGKSYNKEMFEKMSTGRFNLKNGLKNALALTFEQGDLTGYYLYSNLEKLIFKCENYDFYNYSKNSINNINIKQNKINKVPYILI